MSGLLGMQPSDIVGPLLPDAPGEDELDSLFYVLLDEEMEKRPRVLISLLGDPGENPEEVLGSISDICLARAEFPVVVMSDLQPALLATSTAPVEFLPQRKHVPLLGAEDYRRYVARRWSLLNEKWNVVQEITVGLSIDEFVREQTE